MGGSETFGTGSMPAGTTARHLPVKTVTTGDLGDLLFLRKHLLAKFY